MIACPYNFAPELRLIHSIVHKILELDNIKTHHWSVVGVSAVTGDKLLNAVDWMLDDIAKRIFTLD